MGKVNATSFRQNSGGFDTVGVALVGMAAFAVIAALAYQRNKRRKPMTRLEQLKAQLGLSDADFKDLKTSLGKMNIAELKELNKAAW